MTLQKLDRQCKTRTKSGKRCRAAATEGGLCFFHANPDKASELGRIGGLSKRHRGEDSADPLPSLNNATAVRDLLARLIPDVCAGRLQPKIASAIAPLLSLQLRAIETADLERRLARVEKLVAKAAHDEMSEEDLVDTAPMQPTPTDRKN